MLFNLQLRFESEPAFDAIRSHLESLDPMRFDGILRLVGVSAGTPIRVILASENSEYTRQVSSWTAGFARAAMGEVVIFPSRNLGYPHNSIEDVLRHEIAHVLVSRAAGGAAV